MVLLQSLKPREMVPSNMDVFPFIPFKHPERRAASYVANLRDQSLSDPVQLMRIYAEKAQKQRTSSNHSNTQLVAPSGSSGQGDESGKLQPQLPMHGCLYGKNSLRKHLSNLVHLKVRFMKIHCTK
ncbi:hypothetical protein RIF29_00863 [Crotalaria pallida]|uniref:Uncharacterized protein n=1 Tax=Crotalaria pallida TaxID=3830 RepID=A0AAN9P7C4_CROPI